MITSDPSRRQDRSGRRLTSSYPLDDCFHSDITDGVLGPDSGSGNERESKARLLKNSGCPRGVPNKSIDKGSLHLESQHSFLPCSRRNFFHPLSEAVRRSFFNSRRKHSAPSVPCAI